MIRGFLNLLPTIIDNYRDEEITYNCVNACGTFLMLTAQKPNKMEGIYKIFVQTDLLQRLGHIILQGSGPLAHAAVHALSVGIHPFNGEVYNFPWKRGPHPAIGDYNECKEQFEEMRKHSLAVLQPRRDSNEWLSKLAKIYFETESVSQVTQTCALRITLQMAKVSSSVCVDISKHSDMMKVIHNAFAKDEPAHRGMALQLFHCMISEIEHKRIDFKSLKIDLQKLFDAFEKNVVTDPLSSIFAVGCLSEILKLGSEDRDSAK